MWSGRHYPQKSVAGEFDAKVQEETQTVARSPRTSVGGQAGQCSLRAGTDIEALGGSADEHGCAQSCTMNRAMPSSRAFWHSRPAFANDAQHLIAHDRFFQPAPKNKKLSKACDLFLLRTIDATFHHSSPGNFRIHC